MESPLMTFGCRHHDSALYECSNIIVAGGAEEDVGRSFPTSARVWAWHPGNVKHVICAALGIECVGVEYTVVPRADWPDS